MSNGPIHFAVPREAAKEVFSRNTSDDLQSLLFSWRNDEDRQQANLNLPASADWKKWHELFATDLQKTEENAALAFVFLGGRELPSDESAVARLIRPDLIAHVAVALERIDRQQFSSLLNEQAAADLNELQEFFEAAAAARSAVVFYSPTGERGA